MSTRSLCEEHYTPISDRIDLEAGVIRNVKIVGKESKWGYTYSDEALHKAVAEGMYEGVPVMIDHPERDNPRKTRSLMENVGWIRDAKWKPDGIWGDFHYLTKHQAMDVVLEKAQKNPKGFGLSHNVDVAQEKHREGTVITQIKKVRSVDLVGTPATTDGLFEGYVEPEEKSRMKTTLRKLVESYGSASEKKHLALLESAAVLDNEIEMEEPEKDEKDVVKDAFAESVKGVMEKDISIEDKQKEIQGLLDAQKVLANGKPEETPEPQKETPTVESLSEELEQYKRRDGVRTLLEEYSVPATEVRIKALANLDKKEDQIALLEDWKDSGKPTRSGRRDANDDSGPSTYDEHVAEMKRRNGN